MVQLLINGQEQTCSETNLAQWMQSHYDGATVAVAINGTFISKSAYAQTELKSGDQLEVCGPMQGG